MITDKDKIREIYLIVSVIREGGYSEERRYETNRIMQCVVYLLQEKKSIDTKYDFKLTVKGVYSVKLQKDIDDIKMKMMIDVLKRQFGGWKD